jgi:hypothetical protein
MILQLNLKVDGDFIYSDKRVIGYKDPKDEKVLIRILKPDIITLQSRGEDGSKDTVVARVFSLTSLDEGSSSGAHETPQKYVERMYRAYLRIQKNSLDPKKDEKLADIKRKIAKVCKDKKIVDPLANNL